MICPVDCCDRPIQRGGYCDMHYQRIRKHGDPHVMKRAPNGAGSMHGSGYRRVNGAHGSKGFHRALVERVLGRPLKPTEEVHHVNEDKDDNRHSNLVVCPDRAYHALLHRRQRALDICGNANYRKCVYCLAWDDPARLVCFEGGSARAYHGECHNAVSRERYHLKRRAA